jgi:hypothetical protein
MSWFRKPRRKLEDAERKLAEAERKEEEVKPLVNSLRQHDRVNHLSLRVRASWFGGQQP